MPVNMYVCVCVKLWRVQETVGDTYYGKSGVLQLCASPSSVGGGRWGQLCAECKRERLLAEVCIIAVKAKLK